MTAYARSVDMDRVIAEVKPLSARVGRTKSSGTPSGTPSGWRVVGEDGQPENGTRAVEPAPPELPAATHKPTVGKRPPVAGRPSTPAAKPAQASTAAPAPSPFPPAATAAAVAAPAAVTAASKPGPPKRKPVDLDAFLGCAPAPRTSRPKAPEPPDPLARLMSGEGLSNAKVDTQLTRLIDAWQTLPQSVREAIVELMETSIHGHRAAPACDASDANRSARPNGSAGWRRIFNVLARP